MVIPEEALQNVPSDDEDEDEAHAGHAHQTQFDPAKQAALQQRRKEMEEGRKRLIKELYVPRHPHLYTLSPEVGIDPAFPFAWLTHLRSASLFPRSLKLPRLYASRGP